MMGLFSLFFTSQSARIWKALTVDEVKDELTVIVQDKKRFQFFEQWFDKRFREADIDVDGYYGSWTPKSLAVT